MNEHEQHMQRALDLALNARGKTSPNPMVGCVIVKNGKVIAEGWHRRAGTDHAEVDALKKAGTLAQGATMYVTLEPCGHFGRTPPCVDAIVRAGIKTVYVAMKDPNAVNNGKSLVKLRRAGIQVFTGLLADEASSINESFVKWITTGNPLVVAKIAQTLDGKIATASGQSKWITSERSRWIGHQLRDDFDAICVGINTVLKDNPSLSAPGKNKRIKKIVLDSMLRTPQSANIFKQTPPEEVCLVTTASAPGKLVEQWRKRGVDVMIAPSLGGKINIAKLLKELGKRNITSVLIEGGPKVIGAALAAKSVDKILMFIAPKILGSQDALSSVTGLKAFDVNTTITLEDIEFYKNGEDLMLEGRVRYP